MKHLFYTLALAVLALTATAQENVRIGYIDFEKTLSEMPEYADAQKQLNQLAQNYAEEYARMEKEYTEKVKDYVANGKTLSEPIKLARQSEITECEDRMDLFKKRYTSELEKQRETLLSPLRSKLSNAIKQAADAQQVTLVLDGQTPLYMATTCIDLTNDVKALLKTEDK